jgi:hypothetical protein
MIKKVIAIVPTNKTKKIAVLVENYILSIFELNYLTKKQILDI